MKYPIRRKKFLQGKRVRKDLIPKPANPRIAVPSFFTLMNLFSGFLSLIMVAKGNYLFGAWLIVIAGMFDVFDGLMARLTDSTSEFGIELDSISDVVSFGVAPGFLIYQYSLVQLDLLGIIISALPPLCGAVRLARFNVNAKFTAPSNEFSGLPIPAQAIFLVGFFLTFRESPELFEGFKYGLNSVLIPLVAFVSFLMVSPIPFDKIPKFKRGAGKHEKQVFLLFSSYLVIILVFQQYGLILAFSIFILKGMIVGVHRFWNNAFEDDDKRY